MIPRDVAELLDRLDTQVANGVTSVKSVAWIAADLRATLTRAFGERVLECSTCVKLVTMSQSEPVAAIDVNGHMECPVCKDRNHLRVREQ